MLPRGIARKVTIYLNQDTRTHLEPLWSAILAFLRHKRCSGATLFRADAAFGARGQLHDPRSEYVAEQSPVRIEFIETPERVDELLPTLYEMVTDGLITVQDISVVKCASKDAKAQPIRRERTSRVVSTPAKMVRIFLGESDTWKGQPLHEAIVQKLRIMDISGATVYRGILGYGAKGHTHKTGKFHFSRDLPIMISIIEKVEKVNELIQAVSEMMQDGIIVTSDVELHQITPVMVEAEETVAHEQ